MAIRIFISILAWSLLVCNLPCQAASPVKIFTEDAGLSNYIDTEGQPAGFNVDMVREIIRRLGYDSKIEFLPWSRGYNSALMTPNVALFSTARIPERENNFKWVGPLHMVRTSFFMKKGTRLKVLNFGDAYAVDSIACIADDVRQVVLDEMGFDNLQEVYGAEANLSLLKMLDAGRVDLIVSSPGEMYVASQKTGILRDDFEEVLVIDELYTYVAFSKSTPDEIVAGRQSTLDAMKTDGTYEFIMRSHPTGAESMAFHDPFEASPIPAQ